MATRKKMWNTTQLSLHERFTLLRNQRQQQQQSTAQEVRRSLAAARQNQRMLLQMERRPAVMAALKIKQKSVRQRLGQIRPSAGFTGRVTDRLSTSVVRSPGNRGPRALPVGLRGRTFRPQTQFSPARNLRVAGRTRGIVRRPFQGNLPRGRNVLAMDSIPRFQTRPQFQSQNFPLFQTRRPLNRSQFQNKIQYQSNQNTGRFQNQSRNQSQSRGQILNRNQNVNRNQNRMQGRNQRRGQTQNRSGRGNNGSQPFNKGRGNRGGQGGFKGQGNQRNTRGGRPQRGSFRRGQGRGRGRQGPTPSKEELDKQLDQYMASTKSTLDKELDTYMNQSDV